MSNRAPKSRVAWTLCASVAVHAMIGVAAFHAPKKEEVAPPVPITFAEAPAPPPPPPEPPPPPPEPPAPTPEPARPPPAPVAKAPPKAAPPPPSAAPPPAAADASGFADLGLTMGNGSGGGGVAVATGRPAAAQPAPVRKVVASAPKPTCSEPPSMPRPKKTVNPEYTAAAAQAEIEGPVRIEVTIDEKGHVTKARIVKGLGYGLDESALTAAKQFLFEPSTACGKPVVGHATFQLRFAPSLGS